MTLGPSYLVLLAALIFAVSPAVAGPTTSGSTIVNIATMKYTVAGVEVVVQSNPSTILIGERLDVALSRQGASPIAPAATAIPFLLTNRGTGQEAFTLSVVNDTASPPTLFAIDQDEDGRYDPAHDQLLTNARTPMLAPGTTVQVLLLADFAGQFDGVQNTITARAVTGYGAPGAVFQGQGDGGSDAVVGPTGAQAQIVVPMIGTTARGSLIKTQTVLAPDGSARAVHDAVITYTLMASVPGPSSNVRIDDPIPPGTIYLPGSLTLDGTPLSDASDSDPGSAGAGGIAVSLGTLSEPAIRTILFKVRIQ